MKQIILFLSLIGLPFYILGQSLYNPQQLYDEPGGLFDKDSIRSIYVDFEDPNYHNVLVNSFFNDPSYRIPATLTLDEITLDSIGIRYKGNSTFCLPNDQGNPKVPYNFDMNYWISGQNLMDYKKIKLANAWLDPTFAKEFSGALIYRNYLPTPEVNLVKLHVQGNYLGLYVNTESINKQFLEKHFDEKDGVLFKCDGAAVFCGTTGGGEPVLSWEGSDSINYYDSYTIKSDYGWEELMELINTLNFNPSELDSVLNIDRVLWAFAVNSVISNLDTYNGYYVHNYYLYKTEDGLFQMIPWDLDNSFIGAIMGLSFFNPAEVYEFDPYFGQDTIDQISWRPLTGYLLNDPQHRKQYTAHMRTVINEALDTAAIRSSINQLQTLAYDAANTDNHKAFSMDLFSSNVEEAFWTGWGFAGILSTVDARKEYLLSHPEIALSPPTLDNVSVSDNIITVTAGNESSVELMATTSQYNSKFQSFPMFDDGTNGDINANDGIYSAMLPFSGSPDIKFYIRAQNDDAMALSPERAEYEFYEYPTTTSAESINLAQIKIYPNPTNSKVNIRFGNIARVDYHLSTLTGRSVLKGIINSNQFELDLSNLPRGMYILKIGNETYKILKIE